MHTFPKWKYWLVIIVLALGVIFAVPNLFGDGPSLQLVRQDRQPVDAASQQQVLDALKAKNLVPVESYIADKQLALRFASEEEQAQARAALLETTRDYSVALAKLSRMPSWMRIIGLKKMSFGLDLRGGVHFVYQVDVKSAVSQTMARLERDLRTTLRNKHIPYAMIQSENETIRITLRAADQAPTAVDAIQKSEEGLVVTSEEGAAGTMVTVTLSPDNVKQRQDSAILQNITTLRNRVNELGVSEPVVARQGADRILVQLPGMQDPNEAERVIGATATLEFHLVDEVNDPYQAQATKRVPIGSKLYKMRQDGRPILLKRELIASGEQLVDANTTFDQGQPATQVKLDARGGAEMLKTTQQNVGHRMAVVFIEKKKLAEGEQCNGVRVVEECTQEDVISDARINGIFGDRFIVTGLSVSEARELALLLRAGSLAATIYQVDKRTVGPSTGQDNINKGVRALIIGLALTFAFMAIYYRAFGMVANAVLLSNIILLTALMSLLPVSLSLPGIAGLVLTVGMAVDANILIYERIREELRLGNSPQAAINAGFEKAFSAIADSNVTTLIAGVVLIAMASGPIRGFAVVLTLGIATSMFTAIIGSRALVHALWGRQRKLERLSI